MIEYVGILKTRIESEQYPILWKQAKRDFISAARARNVVVSSIPPGRVSVKITSNFLSPSTCGLQRSKIPLKLHFPTECFRTKIWAIQHRQYNFPSGKGKKGSVCKTSKEITTELGPEVSHFRATPQNLHSVPLLFPKGIVKIITECEMVLQRYRQSHIIDCSFTKLQLPIQN